MALAMEVTVMLGCTDNTRYPLAKKVEGPSRRLMQYFCVDVSEDSRLAIGTASYAVPSGLRR